MLPRPHRLRDSRTFTTTVRRGRRARAGAVLVHLSESSGHGPARVGLIVSRQVGNSVQRHHVSRVLRHAVATHLHRLPAGSSLVIRALPGATARDEELAVDLARALDRLDGAPRHPARSGVRS